MAGLVCPHCGSATAFTPVLLRGNGIDFSESGKNYTKHAEVGIKVVVEHSPGPHVAVIQCQGQGCEKFFVAIKEYWIYGGWRTAWPLVSRAVSDDIPGPIKSAFRDAVMCLGIGSFGGCLMMCRTVLIRLQRQQGVGSLQELSAQGRISQQMYEQADEVRLWSNMVGHEDFDQGALTNDTCEELVDYIESLLNALYVQPARLARHRELRKQAKSK